MTPAATLQPTDSRLVQPHGGTLVDRWVYGDDATQLAEHAQTLERVVLSDIQVADLEMIAVGAMSPLEGFVTSDDYERVIEDCRLADGTVWPFPITLRVDAAPAGDEIALATADGQLLGVMDITDVYTGDKRREAELVYGTTDAEHPGVALLYAQGETILGGPIRVFDRLENLHGDYLMTPAETRAAFDAHGWRRVVGFQTRNPVHRAHEYLIRCAMENTDGLLLHPLVGRTKDGDISAEVRMRCYEVLLSTYFPKENVQLSVFPAAMRYAGPREAIFHALCRKNYGCSHFIVGRDHAGVGSYYGTYDAQEIFDGFTLDEIGIEILRYEHSFWCKLTGGMATTKTSPSTPEQRVFLSGTKVREMLDRGEIPPVEFTRPEVAEILIEAYRTAQ